jgi:hypothetical protein
MSKPNDYQYDVFLSHSSHDKEKVRLLARRLQEHGISYWLDEEQIKPGDPITSKIEHGLAGSRWILVALSKAAGTSPWCSAEYQPFLHKEIKAASTRVIPVLLESMDDDDIPLLLFDKSRVDLAKEVEFQQLVERVRRPLTIDDYCNGILSQPLVSGRIYNGDYQIEPSDLLRIELREIDFQFGDPVRAVRSGKTLKIEDLIDEITNADAASRNVIILLGEAGVGKTTTCKWLCRLLAQSTAALSVVPLHVALGEWDVQLSFQAMLDQQVRSGTFDELVGTVQSAGYRLMLFLDGWNEQDPDRLKQVKAFLRKRADLQNAIVVLTSRPVTAVDAMWEGREARFFEIRRWTEQQLENYFKINKQADLFAQIPKEALNCLRLPLLAFLLIRRLVIQDESLPSLRTVADVFAFALGQFLGLNVEKSRAIPQIQANLSHRPEGYLQQLAHRMTADNVIQTAGATLEEVLSEADQSQFKPFLAGLVNSGLLRSSNAVVALDPEASLNELRKLKIGFLHQAFQEYLTAQWFLSSGMLNLPPDVSHNAFWREIPVYMIQSYAGSVGQQERFALSFIQGSAPDFLTSARLANEITDPGVRQSTQGRIVEELVINIREPGMYAYVIEAFKTLGLTGQKTLQANLDNTTLLMTTYARAEAHLVEGSTEGAEEATWRTLGRSIYLLGELGDFWLARHLAQQLESIRSLHLLYHIGEALLTLARMPELSEEDRGVIRAAGAELEKHSRGDSVVRSYGFAIVRTCGDESKHQLERAEELKDLLYRQTDTTRQHFREEFWRRAHGAEAFAEVAVPDLSVDVLVRLFETENTADYGDYKDGDYRPVQSSILKAVLRSCDLYPGTAEHWRPLLERIFQSERIAANGWACRHLERLLLKWYNAPKELGWIKDWKDSTRIGGSRITNVLSNVIWLSS